MLQIATSFTVQEQTSAHCYISEHSVTGHGSVLVILVYIKYDIALSLNAASEHILTSCNDGQVVLSNAPRPPLCDGSSIPLPVVSATRLSEDDTDDELRVEEDDYECDNEDENDDDHDMAAETYFIRLSPSQLKMLIAALEASHASFRPLTIHGFDAGKAVHRALKERSNCSAARRLTSTPASTFPMYYFFYGTLAQPDNSLAYSSFPQHHSMRRLPSAALKLARLESTKRSWRLRMKARMNRSRV
jgi:hypothetical protein